MAQTAVCINVSYPDLHTPQQFGKWTGFPAPSVLELYKIDLIMLTLIYFFQLILVSNTAHSLLATCAQQPEYALPRLLEIN